MKKELILVLMTTLALSACNSEESVQSLTQSDPTAPAAIDPSEPFTDPMKDSSIPTGSDLFTGPADLEKYVVKFVDDAKAQGIDVLPEMTHPKLELRVASLDSYGSSTIGLCQTGGGLRRVTFDPDFWNSVSETQREILAHHELGHCVLLRGHRTTTLPTGKYASVMYPTVLSSSTYTGNYGYYQEELFTYGVSASESAGDEVKEHVCN